MAAILLQIWWRAYKLLPDMVELSGCSQCLLVRLCFFYFCLFVERLSPFNISNCGSIVFNSCRQFGVFSTGLFFKFSSLRFLQSFKASKHAMLQISVKQRCYGIFNLGICK